MDFAREASSRWVTRPRAIPAKEPSASSPFPGSTRCSRRRSDGCTGMIEITNIPYSGAP